MTRFVIFKRIDGTEVLVPIRRWFQTKANTPLAGVQAFTARHNAIQAERTD